MEEKRKNIGEETEISELLRIIREEKELENFFSKVVLYLRRFCKKCEIIWEEKGKVKHVIKVGRSGIEKREYDTFPEIKENGYKIVEIKNDALRGKALLKAKIKSKISKKKFYEIVDIISLGISTVIERKVNISERLFSDQKYKDALETAKKIAEYMKNLCFSRENYKAGVDAIKIVINEIIPTENVGIVVSHKGIEISEFKIKDELKEKISEILKKLEIPEGGEIHLEGERYFYFFPVKIEGQTKGVIAMKTKAEIPKEVLNIMDELAKAFSKSLEIYILEKERREREFGNMLDDLSTAIAIYSKEKGSSNPIFENKKFRELSSLPNFYETVKADIEQSLRFGISSMREVDVSGKTFIISTRVLENEKEIMIEATDITSEKEKTKYKSEMEREKCAEDIAKILSRNTIKGLDDIIDEIKSIEDIVRENRVKEKLKSIESSSKIIKGSVEEFLSAFENIRGREEKFDVHQIAESAKKVLEEKLEEKNIKIEIEGNAFAKSVFEKVLALQIFLNLFQNIAESEKEKDGKLSKPKTVSVKIEETPENFIKIEIESTEIRNEIPDFTLIKDVITKEGGNIEIDRKLEDDPTKRGRKKIKGYIVSIKLPRES